MILLLVSTPSTADKSRATMNCFAFIVSARMRGWAVNTNCDIRKLTQAKQRIVNQACILLLVLPCCLLVLCIECPQMSNLSNKVCTCTYTVHKGLEENLIRKVNASSEYQICPGICRRAIV